MKSCANRNVPQCGSELPPPPPQLPDESSPALGEPREGMRGGQWFETSSDIGIFCPWRALLASQVTTWDSVTGP